MRSQFPASGLFVLLLAAGCAPSAGIKPAAPSSAPSRAFTSDAAGSWTITQATNPTGQTYGGTVNIQKLNGVYRVEWHTDRGENTVGTGLLKDNHLFVGWPEGWAGIVVYKIGRNGTLSAEWAQDTTQGIGTEEATGGQPGQVEGNYQLTGRNSDGTQYLGTLAVVRNGDVYNLSWGGRAGPATGVAIRTGDWLAAGYGPSGGSVVAWTFTDANTAVGNWAVRESNTLATENIKRN